MHECEKLQNLLLTKQQYKMCCGSNTTFVFVYIIYYRTLGGKHQKCPLINLVYSITVLHLEPTAFTTFGMVVIAGAEQCAGCSCNN